MGAGAAAALVLAPTPTSIVRIAHLLLFSPSLSSPCILTCVLMSFFSFFLPVYTFLATLVLLLGVSGAIIVRSLLLRRRHRRMVEEAIANGTWIPPAPRIKVDLRKKPKLWDAYVSPPPAAGEGKEWDRVMVGPRIRPYTPASYSILITPSFILQSPSRPRTPGRQPPHAHLPRTTSPPPPPCLRRVSALTPPRRRTASPPPLRATRPQQ